MMQGGRISAMSLFLSVAEHTWVSWRILVAPQGSGLALVGLVAAIQLYCNVGCLKRAGDVEVL
jgi:hypothetical protein